MITAYVRHPRSIACMDSASYDFLLIRERYENEIGNAIGLIKDDLKGH